jgi:HicB family
MSRLTLRLPETLHRQLEELAQSEEISLNQFIVYALTRQVTSAYTVQAFPEKAIAQQQATYNALLQTLGDASSDQIEQAMAGREPAPPENGLTYEVIKKIHHQIKGS